MGVESFGFSESQVGAIGTDAAVEVGTSLLSNIPIIGGIFDFFGPELLGGLMDSGDNQAEVAESWKQAGVYAPLAIKRGAETGKRVYGPFNMSNITYEAMQNSGAGSTQYFNEMGLDMQQVLGWKPLACEIASMQRLFYIANVGADGKNKSASGSYDLAGWFKNNGGQRAVLHINDSNGEAYLDGVVLLWDTARTIAPNLGKYSQSAAAQAETGTGTGGGTSVLSGLTSNLPMLALMGGGILAIYLLTKKKRR